MQKNTNTDSPGAAYACSAALKSPSPAESPGTDDLIRALQVQGEQYSSLLALLDSLNTSAGPDNTHSQALLNSIRHQLHNLDQTTSLCARIRQALGEDVVTQSPELRAEVTRQEKILKTCLQRIAGLETDFIERRKRLLPELDASARRKSMQSAYQRSLGTG